MGENHVRHLVGTAVTYRTTQDLLESTERRRGPGALWVADGVVYEEVIDGGWSHETAGGVLLTESTRHNTSQTPAPLAGVRYTSTTFSEENPRPITSLEGRLFGFHNGVMYSKDTANGDWRAVGTTPEGDSLVRLHKTSDDQLIAVTSSGIYKSARWRNGTVWVEKVKNTGGVALMFGSTGGGNGTKFIFSEYAAGNAGAGWEDSQKAWVSEDAGDTWHIGYDATVVFPDDYEQTHIHGANYDPVTDLFFLIEGHSTSKGVYWAPASGSANLTWTRINKGAHTFDNGGAPTVIAPARHGIVMASDSAGNGMYVVERGQKPADMSITWAWEWVSAAPQIAGFGACYAYDEKEGVVYIGWTVNSGLDLPLIITASDGIGAGVVWTSPAGDTPVSASSTVRHLAVTPWGTLVGATDGEIGSKAIEGVLIPPGGISISRFDTGGVLGGQRNGLVRSLAAGGLSLANNDCIAIGAKAIADSDVDVSNHLALAIGNRANAGYRSVAIGHNATNESSSGVAVGESATAEGGVSIGRATQSGVQSVSVGRNANSANNAVSLGWSANASANNTLAIGEVAIASVTGAVAIGKSADAGHILSVAIGRDTATSEASQVALGPRHIEITELPSGVGVAAAGKARLQILEVGGKMELSVQFPSGAKQVLATEP